MANTIIAILDNPNYTSITRRKGDRKTIENGLD